MTNRLSLPSAQETVVQNGGFSRFWRVWFERVTRILSGQEPYPLPRYTVAQLGGVDPANWLGALVYVSDEAGGAVVAYSDGTDWRRLTDRSIVS